MVSTPRRRTETRSHSYFWYALEKSKSPRPLHFSSAGLQRFKFTNGMPHPGSSAFRTESCESHKQRLRKP